MGNIDLLFILGAWVFWGTYPVPFKSPSAKKANTDPFAFQFMKSSCVFLTSWLILTWREFTFTYWGLVGAALWIPAGLLFITSVKLTGVAFATPMANGVQVIVSFCWGAFYFHEVVHNAYLSVLAMAIMIVGMIGISISVNYEKMQETKKAKLLSINVASSYEEQSPLISDQPTNQQKRQSQSPLPQQHMSYGTKLKLQKQKEEEEKTTKAAEVRKFILGIIAAFTSGVFGATQNVPLKNAPPEAHGIAYVISFGIGAVIIISIFTAIYVAFRWFMKMGLPTVNPKLSIVPGTIAGLLWSAGNICNIYATLAYGATVGFPLVMCNMMVAGCWGVFYYNEAKSYKLKGLFVLSCATLLGGVTLLSRYG